MGYINLISRCLFCKEMFVSNPDKVPSLMSPETGHKEPICKDCIDWVNGLRVAQGDEPFSIHPNAYEPQHYGDEARQEDFSDFDLGPFDYDDRAITLVTTPYNLTDDETMSSLGLDVPYEICPECESPNLNEERTRCFDCEPC